jgi:hypothetical protein
MSSGGEPRREAALRERATLSERIAVAPAHGVAYVPDRVLCRGAEAERRVERVARSAKRVELDQRDEDAEGPRWVRWEDVPEPLALVELLRSDGLEVQPEHVFFAHPCDPCAAAAHPCMAFGELRPAPYHAHSYRANPYHAHSYRANPFRANPYHAHEVMTSSAAPAADRAFPERHLEGPGAHPRITVLDTGLAGGTEGGVTNADSQRPALLTVAGDPDRIAGAMDHPDASIMTPRGSVPSDGWLNPVAGHGTFIAGLIEQLAPGCRVRVEGVVGPLGDVREGDVYQAILAEADHPSAERPAMLSMSFGGRVLGSAPALRSAVARATAAGILVVASAGNDGSPLPQYPAAFPHVIAVAAIGPDGPPPWTNYGDWVDACAPGVDLVSAFFAAFNGPSPIVNTVDPDDFAEWATWSGTSFSAPVVVAALAREMVLGDCAAAAAADRVIRAPHLLRIPCLGTVVNV